MRRAAARLFLALLLVAPLGAQPYVPGQTYFGANNYIEYQAGDCPVIITAPHGGSLTPGAIPNRANGTYNGVTYTDIVTVTDGNTEDLARRAADEIFARTGRRPHLVICRLARIKLDANRDIGPAALGNAIAEQAWQEYQDFINAARASANAQFGFGFLVDLHGHGHAIQRLELGYGHGNADLNQTDAALNHAGYLHRSTLRTLPLVQPGVPYPVLLRGPGSLGDLFNLRSFPAWPSPEFPAPGASDFFSGGFTVQTHTCQRDNSLIHGVQIECNMDGVRDNSTNRQAFAAALARVLHIYLYKTYGYTLGAQSVTAFESPVTSVLTRGGAPLTLTATRTENLSLGATIALAFGGTAVAGVDYTASASSLVFTGGQTTQTVTLTPAATAGALGDRTLTVALAPSVTQTADATPLVFTLGDGVSQSVRVHALASSVNEGDGTVSFRFTRTLNAAPLTVPLTWSGTAVPEADYHAAPTQLLFPAGTATLDLSVPLVDDGRPEPDRFLTVTVGAGDNHAAGAPASATVRIRDDDRPAGLALWLRGDAAGNIAFDSSGHDRHGTTLPADGTDASGPVAQLLAPDQPALEFDGVDDTVILPRFPVDPDGEFTVAFFFRLQLHPSGSADQHSLFGSGTRGNDGTLQVYLSSSTNLRTSLPSGGTATLLNASLSLPGWQNNAWRHYALTVAANGTARVYINGQLVTTVASARTGTLSPDEIFWLGWRPVSGTGTNAYSFMKGGLRDFRIYQRALAAPEITALANTVQNYAAWLTQRSLPGDHAATADSDADGFPALVEYALAARPDRSGPPPRYTLGTDSGRLTLSFLRDPAATDLTWTIEAGSDLASWQPLASRTGLAGSWTVHVGGAQVAEQNGYVTVTDAVAATPARFLRLKISLSP